MTMSTGPLSYVEKTLFCLGFLLIWAALVGNEWALVKLFSSDGVVESYNRVAIRVFGFLLLTLGVFCVLRGKRLIGYSGRMRAFVIHLGRLPDLILPTRLAFATEIKELLLRVSPATYPQSHGYPESYGKGSSKIGCTFVQFDRRLCNVARVS
jgi:hypothetical protein